MQQTIPIIASDMPYGDIFYLAWGHSGDYFIIGDSSYNPETMPVASNALQVRRYEDNQVMVEFLGLAFQGEVDLVDWSLNDKYVAIGSSTYTGYDSIKIITPDVGAMVNEIFIPHGQNLFALRWNPVLPQLAVAIAEGNETSVWLCDTQDAFTECMKSATVDMSISDIQYSPDGIQFAFKPYLTHNIAIYDFNLARVVKTLIGHTDFIQRFSWGTSGIASTTADKKLYIWNPATAHTIAITEINYHPEALQWNQEGTLLLLTDGRRVELRNGSTGALIAQCVACINHLSD